MSDDYCEFCELPWSTCIHGNPPAPPPEPVRAAPRTTSTRAPRASAAGSTGSTTRSRAAAAAPARVRRRTPAEEFEPHILAVLADLGGEAEATVVMDVIAERLADDFRSGDNEAGPTGELRWRTACRTARKHLADGGRLVAPRPGVWRLSE